MSRISCLTNRFSKQQKKAARGADAIAIGRFLNYELEEHTPDHWSWTILRQRLGWEIYQKGCPLCREALPEHGWLRGKNRGRDASVREANASLRAWVHRNPAEPYWDYVQRLAAEPVLADKGYYAVDEGQALQREAIPTVIADPGLNRRWEKLGPPQRQAVQAARRSPQSNDGKALLRRRGRHLER